MAGAKQLYRQLLDQAADLARADSTRPQQANLRRAASTAYYALFHFLIEQATRSMIGSRGDQKWLRHLQARAFNHGEMKQAARAFSRSIGAFPKHVRECAPSDLVIDRQVADLAATFAAAQELRHLADYDLSLVLVRQDVVSMIERIEQAIGDTIANRHDPAVQFFLVSLLIWNRIVRR